MDNAADRPGDGVDGVAKTEFEFFADFQPIFWCEPNHLRGFVQFAEFEASLKVLLIISLMIKARSQKTKKPTVGFLV